MDNNNDKLELFVRNKIDKFVKQEYNPSELINYNKICEILNKVREQDKSQPLEIELKHSNKESIKIYDEEEWILICNYNIINEYIKGKKLKIYSKAIKHNEIINKKENLKNIINSISKKLSENSYSNIIFKFITINKEILDSFITFYINELKNSNLKELEKNLEMKNKSLKDNLIELINNTDISGEKFNDNISKDTNNLYIEQNKKYLKTLDEIKDIIKDFKEEKEDSINQKENFYNSSYIEQRINIEKLENDEQENIFLTYFNKNANRDLKRKLLDEKEQFKIINKEEYYQGIEIYKDELNRKILSIK